MPHSLYHSPARAPEYALAAGWGATRLMGVTASGMEIAFLARPARAATSRVAPAVSAELFVGETAPGLDVRSFAVGAELWSGRGRVRVGAGLGTGVVAYRRATNGEWPFLLTCGIRAGIEADVLRLGAGEVVLGAHGAASLGPWTSGHLAVGWRWRAGSR